MDELLPIVTSTLSTPEEVAEVVERALADGVALLLLDADGAEVSARYVVELVCRAIPEPIALLGEVASDTVLGYTPMRLSPLSEESIDALHAILEKHAARKPSSVRGPSGKYPAPGRTGEWQTNRPNPTTDPIEESDDDDLSTEVDDPLLSVTIGGKYYVEATLGSGAMGRVYRARHVALEKPIAIKVLHKKFQKDPQFASRFHREALAASRLDHPNVLRVIDFGDEKGLLYIAMELLSGRDLRSVLEEERALQPRRAVEIIAQVCAGLAAAHESGIVHRDIKPENIVVISTRDDEGRLVEQVKVCDFGIAAVSSATEPRGTGGRKLTEDGAICGTPEYMAPEQARGGDVDARADLYACGVMLYEMVTGQVPFTGPNFVSVLVAHATLDPRPPSALDARVDRRIEQVILRALSKDPAARQQSVRELRSELRAALEFAPAFPDSVKLGAAPRSTEPPPTRREETFDAPPFDAGIDNEADILLGGAAELRLSARSVLLAAGDAGARALIGGRERSTAKIGRGRFVEAMRELGAHTTAALTDALKRSDSFTDHALLEDLLRAINETRDEGLGAEVSRFLGHPSPHVRRAATAALSGVWQLQAKQPLLAAIDDADEGVRIAAIAGLKKISAVDIEVVRRLGKVLRYESPGSDELRAVAAAALGVTQTVARGEALTILARAIEPRSRSVVAMFRGDAAEGDSTILVETIARSLVAVAGDDGRKAVEKRAAKSGAELKAKLNAILRR